MAKTVILSIWKQVEVMRRKWPMFRVLRRTRWSVLWEGPLRPLSQTYTVQLALQRDQNRNKATLSQTLPRVTVVNPLLRRRPENPADPIPHHYPNQSQPELPFLCLFDPVDREWHPGRAVAWTIIPWTIDWLACYEGWLATGEWTGGGRHGPTK